MLLVENRQYIFVPRARLADYYITQLNLAIDAQKSTLQLQSEPTGLPADLYEQDGCN